nr:uncharacterized protein LOC119186679 [Rhipicephalus microplus]
MSHYNTIGILLFCLSPEVFFAVRGRGNMNFVEAVVDKLRDALELMKKLESSWEHLQYNSDTLKDDIEDACSDQIAVVGQRKNRLCFEVICWFLNRRGEFSQIWPS